MKTIKQNFQSGKTPLMVAIAVLVGIGIGYGFRSGDTRNGKPEIHQHFSETSAPSEAKDEQILYICPMNCVPPMEKPGMCPVCGMELMSLLSIEIPNQPTENIIQFSPEAEIAAGIQIAPVERKVVKTEIRLFGKIEYDPAGNYNVTAFAPGIIDRVYIERAGLAVSRGTPLFDIHSSELFFLEQELFELQKLFPDSMDYRPAKGQTYKRLTRPQGHTMLPNKDSGEYSEEQKIALEKIELIRRKISLLGVSKDDIDKVIAKGRPTGIATVTSPTAGIVLEQSAFKGNYVNRGNTIFTISNPRYMWIRLEAYESDFPWIRIGQEAEFETDSYPGEIFEGKVFYLDPLFNKETRTFDVGVLYQDQNLRFKPNMLVRCRIHVRMTEDGVSLSENGEGDKPPLVIPESAPLITGTRAIVYVRHPQKTGVYEAREILLGSRARDYYIVKQGLDEGEHVVVNGNFKIDSAVQIFAKSSMMGYRGGEILTGHHQHETPQLKDVKKINMYKNLAPEPPSIPNIPRFPVDSGSHE